MLVDFLTKCSPTFRPFFLWSDKIAKTAKFDCDKIAKTAKGAVCFSGLLWYTLHSQRFLSEKIQILGVTSQYGVHLRKFFFIFGQKWPFLAIFSLVILLSAWLYGTHVTMPFRSPASRRAHLFLYLFGTLFHVKRGPTLDDAHDCYRCFVGDVRGGGRSRCLTDEM